MIFFNFKKKVRPDNDLTKIKTYRPENNQFLNLYLSSEVLSSITSDRSYKTRLTKVTKEEKVKYYDKRASLKPLRA